MARIVYTYNDIVHMFDNPEFRDAMSLAPHITATVSLMRAIKDRYQFLNTVISIHELQKKLADNWESGSTQFQQFINISSIVNKMSVSPREQSHYLSFTKGKKDALDAIRQLVEADIYPDQLQPSNIEETLFKCLWEKLEEEDESFGQFRAKMALLNNDKSNAMDWLSKTIPNFSSDTVILHGFYFITPMQERIFDMLELCGKKLIFLCCIDMSLPNVNEIWFNTLDTRNGFPERKDWKSIDTSTRNNEAYGEVFEGRKVDKKISNVRIISYASETELVSDIERIDAEGFKIFSTDLKHTEKLLKEFYPQNFKRRHLLSYPIGQYIYTLHSMWNPKRNRLEMSIDDLQACFSSGWVITKGVNAREYTEDLEKLRVYFENVHTINEWEQRLILLQEIEEIVMAPFEAHLENVPEKNRNKHEMMADPFRNFSCFSIGRDRLKTLLELIRQLIKTAEELFSNDNNININAHLRHLRQIIDDGYDESRLLDEEKAVLDELSARLEASTTYGEKTCLPEEISEAVMLIIGDGILDEDNFTVQSGYDETFIQPLYQIESLPLTKNHKVHLCFADETRLPGRKKNYVWPLTDELLIRLERKSRGRSIQYLQDMRHVMNASALSNRYLFYSILQNEEIELSWVDNQDDKEIAPSPYMQVLKEIFGANIEKYKDVSELEKEICETPNITDLEISLTDEEPPEVFMDLALCPWRYVYGYILDKYPSYESNFHYSFAISKLIGALSAKSGFSKDTVAKQVLMLFPYLRQVEKRQIFDYVPQNISNETDAMDGVSYPRERLGVHYLDYKIIETASNKKSEIFEVGNHYKATFNEPVKMKTCQYCPFNSGCPHVSSAEEDGGKDK